jgi:hypothetical protein
VQCGALSVDWVAAVWITPPSRGRDSAQRSIDVEQNVRLNTKIHFLLARYAEDTFERNDRCARRELWSYVPPPAVGSYSTADADSDARCDVGCERRYARASSSRRARMISPSTSSIPSALSFGSSRRSSLMPSIPAPMNSGTCSGRSTSYLSQSAQRRSVQSWTPLCASLGTGADAFRWKSVKARALSSLSSSFSSNSAGSCHRCEILYLHLRSVAPAECHVSCGLAARAAAHGKLARCTTNDERRAPEVNQARGKRQQDERWGRLVCFKDVQHGQHRVRNVLW